MSLFCFASAKGAHGVTTTALATAAALEPADGQRKLLLEADASGGSLAISHQLGRQPGLISLTAAARHGLTRDDLWSHAQELPGGLPAIVAPERGDRSHAVLDDGTATLGPWLAQRSDVITIADCGRVAASQTEAALVAHATRAFLVTQPTAEQIQPATAIAERLQSVGVDVGWLLIGTRPHDAAEVQRATGIEVAAVLPDDARTARAITQGTLSSRLRRSPLARAIHALANDIASAAQPEAAEAIEVPA